MNKKILGGIALVLILFAGAYFGSPYLAARDFKAAVTSGDVDKLDAAVDFPAVRESLKAQFTAAMTRNMANDPSMKDNPFAGLGAMMMPAIIDKAVDAYVTPDGISALVKGAKVQPGQKAPASNADEIDYHYSYVSMDRFRVKLTNKKTGDEGPSLVFERRGLFSWKLIRLELPPSAMNGPMPSAAPRK